MAASTSSLPSSSSSSSTPDAAQLRRRLTHISPTDHLYLRLPSGVVKYIKPWSTVDPFAPSTSSRRGNNTSVPTKQQKRRLKSTTLTSLGKYGTFDLADIETVPFGWTWEIGPAKEIGQGDDDDHTAASLRTIEDEEAPSGSKKRKNPPAPAQPPGSLRITLGATLAELEETTATNEDIYDDPNDRSGPRLTTLDLQAMRDAGLEGQDLIEELTRTSSSFEKRTVYSQDKFIKRKEAKHLRLFTPLAPSLSVMADYHFQRWPEKIRGLRMDSLAQMMSFANVAPGGRYIVVDNANGLLAAACIERMGGQGTLLAIHDNEAQPEFEILHSMNLPRSTIDPVLRVLHWAHVDADFQQTTIPPVPTKLDEEELKKTPEGTRLFKSSERERHKLLKRHAIRRDIESIRADLFSGDWDGLLLASSYDAMSITKMLLPYLGGSANLVVHSPYLQPLIEAHSELRASSEFVNLSLTEPWLRRYQVLPGRTHPEMQTSATGGYLLHAIRVLTDSAVEELMACENKEEQEGASAVNKKVKAEGAVVE